MKNLRLSTILVLAGITITSCLSAAYTSYQQVEAAIKKTYTDITPTGNIFATWKNNYQTKWNTMLKDVASYITTTTKNKALDAASADIRNISDELFWLVDPLKAKIAINTELPKKIAALKARLDTFATKLKPDTFRDLQPSIKNAKKALTLIVSYLQKIALKIDADYKTMPQKITKPAAK